MTAICWGNFIMKSRLRQTWSTINIQANLLNLDNVGNAVLNMEQNMDEQRPQLLAKSVPVQFVRGMATDLQMPLAHFATGGTTADIFV